MTLVVSSRTIISNTIMFLTMAIFVKMADQMDRIYVKSLADFHVLLVNAQSLLQFDSFVYISYD